MDSTSHGLHQKGKKGSASAKSTSGSTKRGRGADDDGWGGFKNYMEAKKYKLGEQFDVETKERKSGIFSGVAIYINGYTKPSSDELRRLITSHGGSYQMYLSKTKVTHVIATNLPNSKFHLAKTMPVVKPEWITESVTAGVCLPHTSYLTISNKSKLQAGLKSLPSVSSLGRNSSTSSLSRGNSSRAINSLSNLAPMISNDSTKNDNCHANEMNHQDIEIDSNDENNEPISIKTYNDVSELISEPEKLECANIKITDNICDDRKDNSSDSELEPDIIYNSEEEEDTPQRLKQHFSMLLKTSKLVNSPSYSLPSEFHIGSNHSSTPKVRMNLSSSKDLDSHISDHQSLTCVPFTAISPILEEEMSGPVQNEELFKDPTQDYGKERDEETLKSKPEVVATKPSPSKSISSSSKNSMAKAGDKGFLNEYYSNSRLHHISQWGAEFKSYVADIQHKGDASFPGRDQLRQAVVENATRLGILETLTSSSHGRLERTVMHIDMDCFFVSVGLLARPDLRGKPVAVTHSKGQGVKLDAKADAELEKHLWNMKKDKGLKTGPGLWSNEKPARNEYDFAVPEGSTGLKTFQSMAEIASCSYEARQKGVKNGMFMGRAKTLCPDLLTIPYDFDGYNRVSRTLYDIVASYTHDIEAVSCDEMFVDCTDVLSDTGASAGEFARFLRKEVLDKTGCTASVGIGPNILLARLATKRAKPNGVFQVFKHDAKAFIKDQKVTDLPGVGYSMSNKLARLGVTTCGDLQSIPESTLRREFGPKTGDSLHRFSLGIDDRGVKGNKQRKSVSAEVNYGIRFTQDSDAVKFLRELSDEVANRLYNLGVKGRSLTLKLMVKRPDAPAESAKFMGHGICNTVTKSTIFPMATSDGNQIGNEVVSMYKHHNLSAPDVRGIGIQVQRLEGKGGPGQQCNSNIGHQSILQFAASTRRPSKNTDSGGSVLQSKEPEKMEIGRKLDNQEEEDKIDNNGSAMVQERSHSSLDVLSMRDVSFLLSPSQVSESVLEELPDDIASEIRNGIEQHKRRKNCQSEPGTSTTLETASHSSSPKQNEMIINDHLPSESQLDMSCFHALPRSLQKELEEAFAKQRHTKKVEEKRASPIKGTALEKLKSPTKDKGKQLKKRRGRPLGSRKTLHTGNVNKSKPLGSKGHGGGKRLNPKTVVDVKVDVDGVICLDDDYNNVNVSGVGGGGGDTDLMDKAKDNDGDSKEPTHVLSPPKVEFCGVSALKDVRSLFKEWMELNAEPVDCDVAMVTDYLTSLVHHKYLEQAFCLLKFLKRYVGMSSRSAVWKPCSEMITALVQSVVLEVHGAELKML